MPNGCSAWGKSRMGKASAALAISDRYVPCFSTRRALASSFAPKAWDRSGSSPSTSPIPRMERAKKMLLKRPTAARGTAPTRPTTATSTQFMLAWPSCAKASGAARDVRARSSLPRALCTHRVVTQARRRATKGVFTVGDHLPALLCSSAGR